MCKAVKINVLNCHTDLNLYSYLIKCHHKHSSLVILNRISESKMNGYLKDRSVKLLKKDLLDNKLRQYLNLLSEK